MVDQLGAELDLDYAEAISGASGLAEAIESAMQEGAQAGAAAVTEALTGATTEIAVEADTTTAEAAIGAVTADPIELPIEIGDAIGAVGDAVSELVDTIGVLQIPIEIEGAEEAAGEIEELDENISDVGVELTTAGAGGQQAAAGFDAAAGGASAASAAASGASGNLAGVVATLGSVSGPAAAATGATIAVGASVSKLAAAGVESISAIERMTQVTGEFEDEVKSIDVGSLSTDIIKLGNDLGETETNMRNAATNAFQFASASGIAGPQAAEFSNQVLALAANAVAANPALGNVGDVAQILQARFARGGQRLQAYGLDLDKAAVNSLALAQTGKTLTKDLTGGERAIAAATLATQQYGDGIRENITEAGSSAEIQQRKLTAAFQDSLAELGRPLVAPVRDIIGELIPLGVTLAEVLGDLGGAALPVLGAAADIVGPPLELIAGILDAIPGPAKSAAVALVAVGFALNAMGGASGIAAFAAGIGPRLLGFLRGVPAALSGVAAGSGAAASGLGTVTAQSLVAAGASEAGAQAFLRQGAAGTAAAGGYSAVAASAGAAVLPVAAFAAASAVWVGGILKARSLIGEWTTDIDKADKAEQALANTAATGTVPAIEAKVRVLRQLIDEESRSLGFTNKVVAGEENIAGATLDSANALELRNITNRQFNDLLKENPAQAAAYVEGLTRAGVATQDYSLQLQALVRDTQAAATAEASLAATASPLTTSFEQGAAAVGDQTQRMFQVLGALGSMVTADLQATEAHTGFVAAIESGNIEQIRAAAVNSAAAAGQQEYAQAIADGVSPQEAATRAVAQQREELVRLKDALPEGGEARAQVEGLIGQLDALGAMNVTPTVSLQDDASVKAGFIKAAIDELVAEDTSKRKVVIALENAAALDATGQVQLAIDAIKAGAPIDVIVNDLATGNIADIQARLDSLDPVKQASVIVTTFGQGDVEALTGAIGALNPKTVEAIANAIGAGDVQALIDIIDNLSPKDVEAVAHALGYSDVIALRDAVNSLQSKDVNVNVRAQIANDPGTSRALSLLNNPNLATGGKVIPAAAGDIFSHPSAYLVGEHGPELFFPDVAGEIVSNPRTRSALAEANRAGGPTAVTRVFNFNVYGDVSDPVSTKRMISSAIAEADAEFDMALGRNEEG